MANKILADLVELAAPSPGDWLLVETPVAARKVDVSWVTSAAGAGAGLAAHLADAVDAHDATAISFAPTGTVAATDVQNAIVEVANEAGTQVAAVTTALNDHIADAIDVHDASAVSFVPGTIVATDVQAAIEEVLTATEAVGTGLSDHIADAADAHDASAISFAPAGTIAATNVQAAIVETAAEAATATALVATGLSDHLVDAISAHVASAIAFTPGTLLSVDVQTAIEEVAALAEGGGGTVLGAVMATGDGATEQVVTSVTTIVPIDDMVLSIPAIEGDQLMMTFTCCCYPESGTRSMGFTFIVAGTNVRGGDSLVNIGTFDVSGGKTFDMKWIHGVAPADLDGGQVEVSVSGAISSAGFLHILNGAQGLPVFTLHNTGQGPPA